mmetsp:Transcript_1022/g.2985  ORF Transcript_1022/g.2985 Transcript_1022/m.2985 type:complete len:80 (+) Transcript_1022:213-452(+)
MTPLPTFIEINTPSAMHPSSSPSPFGPVDPAPKRERVNSEDTMDRAMKRNRPNAGTHSSSSIANQWTQLYDTSSFSFSE